MAIRQTLFPRPGNRCTTIPLAGGAVPVYNSSGLAYYRHPDWLGNSRFASTPTRTPYFDGAYAPFGETYAQTGTTDLSFTGMNQDTVSNLFDFPAREYNGIHGRWPSPDPSGSASASASDPQSWNRYAYTENSPMSSIDPTGMAAIPGFPSGGVGGLLMAALSLGFGSGPADGTGPFGFGTGPFEGGIQDLLNSVTTTTALNYQISTTWSLSRSITIQVTGILALLDTTQYSIQTVLDDSVLFYSLVSDVTTTDTTIDGVTSIQLFNNSPWDFKGSQQDYNIFQMSSVISNDFTHPIGVCGALTIASGEALVFFPPATVGEAVPAGIGAGGLFYGLSDPDCN